MFVDTNVLIYAAIPTAPYRDQARAALARQSAAGDVLCISRQIVREFLAVATRPQVWSQARTTAAAASAAEVLMREFDLLEDGPQVWVALRDLWNWPGDRIVCSISVGRSVSFAIF